MSYQTITVYRCQCDRCYHAWTTKRNVLPLRCAKCNVATWNSETNMPLAAHETQQTAQTISRREKRQIDAIAAHSVARRIETDIDYSDFETP